MGRTSAIRVASRPHAKLRIGGGNDFIRLKIFLAKIMVGDAILVKHIGQRHSIFLGKAEVAVMGINQEKGFARLGSQRSKFVNGGMCFAATAGGYNDIEAVVLQIGQV